MAVSSGEDTLIGRASELPLSFSEPVPQPVELASFAITNFDWGELIAFIIDRFSDGGVFTAIALGHLLQVAVAMDTGQNCHPPYATRSLSTSFLI